MLIAKRTRGFSLVELVIVIVIIGIIAAIAVPRISRGAKGASDSAVRGDLAALRAAIDLFAAEHKGVYPGKVKNTGTGTGLASDFIDHLTKNSATLTARLAITTLAPHLRSSTVRICGTESLRCPSVVLPVHPAYFWIPPTVLQRWQKVRLRVGYSIPQPERSWPTRPQLTKPGPPTAPTNRKRVWHGRISTPIRKPHFQLQKRHNWPTRRVPLGSADFRYG